MEKKIDCWCDIYIYMGQRIQSCLKNNIVLSRKSLEKLLVFRQRMYQEEEEEGGGGGGGFIKCNRSKGAKLERVLR